MNIDKEKIKKAMQNKKFMTTIGALMLLVSLALAFASGYISKNLGNEWAGNMLMTWSQIFMLVFIGLFAYGLFALDKDMTEKFNKRKEKKAQEKTQIAKKSE